MMWFKNILILLLNLFLYLLKLVYKPFQVVFVITETVYVFIVIKNYYILIYYITIITSLNIRPNTSNKLNTQLLSYILTLLLLYRRTKGHYSGLIYLYTQIIPILIITQLVPLLYLIINYASNLKSRTTYLYKHTNILSFHLQSAAHFYASVLTTLLTITIYESIKTMITHSYYQYHTIASHYRIATKYCINLYHKHIHDLYCTPFFLQTLGINLKINIITVNYPVLRSGQKTFWLDRTRDG